MTRTYDKKSVEVISRRVAFNVAKYFKATLSPDDYAAAHEIAEKAVRSYFDEQ